MVRGGRECKTGAVHLRARVCLCVFLGGGLPLLLLLRLLALLRRFVVLDV